MPLSNEQQQLNIKKLNSFLFQHVLRISLFIAWHYAKASIFDSDFWSFAAENFKRRRNDFPEPSVQAEFGRYFSLGAKFTGLSGYLAAAPSVAAEDPAITRRRFAQWRVESFVEIANGLG